MLLKRDGTYIWDIDIAELRISYYNHNNRTIIALTKNKIDFYVTLHASNDYVSSLTNYLDKKEISITPEKFENLSELIHDAGLLELPWNPCYTQTHPEPDKVYQALYCVFNDGAEFIYRKNGIARKEFYNILNILLSFCGIKKNAMNARENTNFKTPCCGAIVLNGWMYCPACGKMARELNRVNISDYIDYDQTIWFCKSCGEAIPMIYKYCGRCGTKRNSWIANNFYLENGT